MLTQRPDAGRIREGKQKEGKRRGERRGERESEKNDYKLNYLGSMKSSDFDDYKPKKQESHGGGFFSFIFGGGETKPETHAKPPPPAKFSQAEVETSELTDREKTQITIIRTY
jgi:hypothetical protein